MLPLKQHQTDIGFYKKLTFTVGQKSQNTVTTYSSVPNKRADPNKRAGRNFLELLITVQSGMFPNKRAGWKIYQKSRTVDRISSSFHLINGVPHNKF